FLDDVDRRERCAVLVWPATLHGQAADVAGESCCLVEQALHPPQDQVAASRRDAAIDDSHDALLLREGVQLEGIPIEKADVDHVAACAYHALQRRVAHVSGHGTNHQVRIGDHPVDLLTAGEVCPLAFDVAQALEGCEPGGSDVDCPDRERAIDGEVPDDRAADTAGAENRDSHTYTGWRRNGRRPARPPPGIVARAAGEATLRLSGGSARGRPPPPASGGCGPSPAACRTPRRCRSSHGAC